MIFVTDRSIGPAEVARATEERGFDSLYLPEHTHIPASRKTPYPGGEPLPDEYFRTYDPFVGLAAAGAVTSRLKLGTGICLVAQHDPIVLAKQVASVDMLSGGRFVFGIGYGWNHDEMEDHGVDPTRRRALVREKVLAMQQLWSEEQGQFDGDFVHLPPSFAWPKPVQQPRPPIVIGGAASPLLFRHIAEYADGWMPIGGRGVADALPDLQAAAEQQGRDPKEIELHIFGARADIGVLEHHAALGARSVVLGLPPAPADIVLPVLDRYAELVGKV